MARLKISAIDLDMLATLMNNGDYEDSYIDPATGELYPYALESGLISDESETEGWIRLDRLSSRDAFRDREEFTDALADDRARERLSRALYGRRPFRAFRAALDDVPQEIRRAWFDYQLASHQLQAVGFLLDVDLVDPDDAAATSEALATQAETALAAVARPDVLTPPEPTALP